MAEAPSEALKMYDYASEQFKNYGITPKKGVFGEHMVIEQVNDGPFTIVI